MEKELIRPCAAVAYIERFDGKLLVVWNKRYGKWSLPGGKVEDDEHPVEGVRREVTEETGTFVEVSMLCYEGPHESSVDDGRGRGRYVYLYRCTIRGIPHECEPGCPVSWFAKDEFLDWGLAPDFYRKAFAKMREEQGY